MEEQKLFEVLSHEIRRKIIRLLAKSRSVSYSELLYELRVDTGTLNYHLSKMREFIEKDENGSYHLSNMGWAAYNILRYVERVPFKPPEIRKSLLSEMSSLLRSWSYVLINPVLALRGANENPLLYAPISTLLSTLGLLTSVRVYGYVAALTLYLTPLLVTYILTSRLYRTKSKVLHLLVNYGLTQYVVAIMCMASEFGLLSLRGLGGALIRSGLTVLYASYMFIFSKESYKLNNSQAFVVAMLTLLLLRALMSVIGISLIELP